MTSPSPHEFVPALMADVCEFEWTDPDDLDDPVHVCALSREDHLPSLICSGCEGTVFLDPALSEWSCCDCGHKFVARLDTTPILNA